jgi:hypothetical protein
MANLVADKTGNFTSLDTWKVCESNSWANANLSYSTNTTTSYVWSAAFTVANGVTIDAILLHMFRVNTTGTFTVGLSNDGGATAAREVTINASDLTTGRQWVVFVLGSTIDGNGAANWKIGIKASSAGNATVYRANSTAGNWARGLRTTGNPGSLAAGDFFIIGDMSSGAGYVVTMDNTSSTQFGGIDIGDGHTLRWGTQAGTNYLLVMAGYVSVKRGGTYECGTDATPIPATSTATLKFQCTSDGQYAFEWNNGSTVRMHGSSRSVIKTRIASNAVAGDNHIHTQVETDWVNGDVIGIASTTTVHPEYSESKIVDTVAGDQINLTTNLANNHSGSDTHARWAGDVILINRNVKVTANTPANVWSHTCGDETVIDVEWVEFSYYGASGAQAISIASKTASSGSALVRYCSFHDSEYGGVYLSSTAVTFTDNVLYAASTYNGHGLQIGTSCSSGTVVVTDNVIMYSGHTTTSAGASFNLNSGYSGINFARTIVAAARDNGFEFTNSIVESSFGIPKANMADVRIYVAKSSALKVSGSRYAVLDNWFIAGGYECVKWVATNRDFTFEDCEIVYPSGHCMYATSSITRTTFRRCLFSGSNSVLQIYGATVLDLLFDHCIFGGNIGGLVTMNAVIDHNQSNVVTYKAVGCDSTYCTDLSSTGIYQSSDSTEGIRTLDLGKADCYHRAYGRVYRTTTHRGGAYGEALGVNDPVIYMDSSCKRVAVPAGGSVAVAVWVYRDNAHAVAPRLKCKRNDPAGWSEDQILDTGTAGAGVWERLEGTVGPVPIDTVLEFCVDSRYDNYLGLGRTSSYYYIIIDDWELVSGGMVSQGQEHWTGGKALDCLNVSIPKPRAIAGVMG